jgi:Holliday junction resolvase RusA-like endonuclease
VTTFDLPWPPSSLSGHAKGHWRAKAALTKQHRGWAKLATQAARPEVPAEGDITVRLAFVPPDRRSDRANFANRCKAYLDGIADGLGVNDRRFVPTYVFLEPEKPGRVMVTIETFAPQGAEA